MGLVNQAVKNLKGGISQQPDILRFQNQGAAQVNCWSSEAQGLQKRSPTTFVKHLGQSSDPIWSDPMVHIINRDASEQYLAIFGKTGMRVVDLAGNEYAVTGGYSYVASPDPQRDLRMVTVGDYTFIVNRAKTVEMDDGPLTHTGYPSLVSRCIINVRGGQYGRTLKVDINGVNAALLVMPDGSVPEHVNQTDAGWIANQIAAQIPTKMGTGWTAVAGYGFVVVTAPAGATIQKVSTEDGYAHQLINAFIYQVQTFAKLPSQAPDGYLVELTGSTGATGDSYWVRYDAAGGVWKETVRPFIVQGLKASTMPHALVRQPNGSFELRPLTWGKRTCGDDTTNPMPSFVGATFNDVFFFRNRLGFLSGENVVLSRSGQFFDFFPKSVATLSDDDPIDVAVSHNRVSVLKYAVPFKEQLLLWSDQAQFVMSAGGILSAKSAQIDLSTEFDVGDNARPFGVGRSVYYVNPRASFTSVLRYYAIQDTSDVKSAEDISAHIPSYIPNGVFNLHGSGTENYLSIVTKGAQSRVYIYKFLYLDEYLVQQSWSHWDFGSGTKVISAHGIGPFMWVIINRGLGVTLERIEFTKNTSDFAQEAYRTHLDMKVVHTPASYDADLNLTTINLASIYGFAPAAGRFCTVDQYGAYEIHEPPAGGWPADPVLRLDGDRTAETFVVGQVYSMLYEFSKFLIKRESQDGSVTTEDSGRLQLRRAWVNYENSGAFTVSVKRSGNLYRYVMSGGVLGSSAVLGELAQGTGQFRFPIIGNAKESTVTLTSDNPNPVAIVGCGWEGNYVRRTSGI